ncbi:MAG: hypothetical protein QM811_26895 [Pirellulales bacterium]
MLGEYKDYKAGRGTSLLGRVLKIGTRLREQTDCVVVLGPAHVFAWRPSDFRGLLPSVS